MRIAKKLIWGFAAIVLIGGALGYFYLTSSKHLGSPEQKDSKKNGAIDNISVKNYTGKKIIFINSYHKGYVGGDAIENGAKSILNRSGVELRVFRMDTKRNTDENFKRQAALKAKSIIEEFEPDVVISSDDNAFKYLIMPYYKDADMPVVFCGVNWDATIYGAPYKNTTGMEEVALIDRLIDLLSEYSKGERIGFLSSQTLSAQKNANAFKKYFKINFTEQVHVKTFAEWKEKFIEIQEKVDMVILSNNAGIEGWDDEEAALFVEKNTKIPTGAINDWMMPYVLIGVMKVAEEQGEWAAKTALKILDGAQPADIPVTKNKKGKLMLNLNVASKLEIVFRPSLLKHAEIIK